MEVVKLKLFPFYWRMKKNKVQFLLKNTIATWDEMTNKFLSKYFPPAKSVKFRGDITTFTQFDIEPIHDAGEI